MSVLSVLTCGAVEHITTDQDVRQPVTASQREDHGSSSDTNNNHVDVPTVTGS